MGRICALKPPLKLKVPSADTVTDDQIDAAAKYAEEGGVSSAAAAKVLQQAATARRDAAVNAVSAQKAQASRDADARHKATDLYQLDIPVEWYGKVATWQNGNTLCIYLDGDANTPLVTLVAVRDGETFTPDDGDTVLGTVSLGNGYTVYASGPVYPYVVPQTINGRTQDPCRPTPWTRPLSLSNSRLATATPTARSRTCWSAKTARPTLPPSSSATTSPRFSCRASRPRTSHPQHPRQSFWDGALFSYSLFYPTARSNQHQGS